MRRVLYLWLPWWPIDRRRRSALSRRENTVRKHSGAPAEETPFATVIETAGRRLLAAVDPAAAAAGLAPGMPLADAFSFLPGLATAAAEPAQDAAALRRLAEWCGRYSPWTAPDGADGVRIEITGSAHLWGGEAALAADLAGRLGRRSIACHIAIADTLGAAWALARFAQAGRGAVIMPPGDPRAGLAALPVAALRLDRATTEGLRRVGLKRVGDLYAMPRDALARRFGQGVALRLDQALGDLPEPLSALGEAPARRVRLSFAEPIADPADLMRAAGRLAEDLVRRLAREGMGARRLDLAFHRVDGRVERIVLGTALPSRDPHHLAVLFQERLDTVDPGLGVEDMILAAFAVEPLAPEQIGLHHPFPPPHSGEGRVGAGEAAGSAAPLLDRLGNKLGLGALYRLEPRESHIPERASICVSLPLPPLAGGEGRVRGVTAPRHSAGPPHPPALRAGSSPGSGPGQALSPLKGGEGLIQRGGGKPPRPIRLLEPPEPVEASWLLPDDPPFRFTWRRRPHRVRRADGPERIAGEWWQPGASGAGPRESGDAIRDYYRVEDEDGRRFWLFRAGLPGNSRPPRWFVHGIFA
jgi:protein ImuB